MSNWIIRKIARKGLKDVNNEKYKKKNMVDTITSYLPSSLPVDSVRIEEEARLQKKMDLIRCLICTGIEMILQTSENTVNKRMKT
jgi:hypothetical protein